MQPSDTISSALQQEYTFERLSSAVYLGLAAAADSASWLGFATWFKKNAAEELEHAGKFYDYMLDRDLVPQVDEIASIGVAGDDSPLGWMKLALMQEQKVTANVSAMFADAVQAGDGQTVAFLMWFLDEQTKSERFLTDIIRMLEVAAGDVAAIRQIQKEELK